MSTQGSTPRAQDEDSLSPLEQEVLDEYARLSTNLGNVSPYISSEPKPLAQIIKPNPQLVLSSHLIDLIFPIMTLGTTVQSPPFPRCSMSRNGLTRPAVDNAIRTIEQTLSGYIGCSERTREEDTECVHVTQGECLQHCLAAGDLW